METGKDDKRNAKSKVMVWVRAFAMVHFTERCAEYDCFSIRTRVATVVETLDVGHALARKLHVTVSKRLKQHPPLQCNASVEQSCDNRRSWDNAQNLRAASH